VASGILDDARAPVSSSTRDATSRMPATWVLAAIVVVGILLRAWRLGFNGLTYDESFTAMAARLPLDELFDHLRTQDSHPPLDYLLRAPFARAGAGDVLLRLPSFLCSVAALVLFACWMRARGVAGVVATAVLAVSSFQILHGGEARMYALLELLGVASAVIADRWLRDDAPRWCAPTVGGLVVLALFDHVSGLLLAAGLVAVAGVRSDRRAWQWRVAIGAAVALWAVVWGTSFAEQAGGDWVGWIPRTSPASFARAVSRQVTDVEPLAWLVLAAVVAGGWCLWRADRRLGRVWFTVGAVPFLAAAAIGLLSPFLIARTLTIASWAPALALGYGGAWVVARWSSAGRAVVMGVLAVVLVGTVTFLAGKRYDSDLAIEHLEAVAVAGDVIVTRPARYATLPAYRIGVERWHDTRWVRTPGMDNAAAFRAGTAPRTGRTWLFTPDTFELSFPGYRACPGTTPWDDGITHVVCLEAVGS
jgi:hypothetical protein